MTIDKSKHLHKEENQKETKVAVKISPQLEKSTHSISEVVQRTIFARYLISKFSNQEDWKKVIWTASFRIGSVKVWACMSFEGVGGIREQNFEYSTGDFDPPNYKTVNYLKVLKTEITGILKAHKMKKNHSILQTDPNCTDDDGFAWIHNKRNPLGGWIFGWPNNSMDLHPMTCIIKLFKDQLGENRTWEDITSVWNSIPKDQVQQSIDKMPHRLGAVLGSKGQAITNMYHTYCLEPEEYSEFESLNNASGYITIFPAKTHSEHV